MYKIDKEKHDKRITGAKLQMTDSFTNCVHVGLFSVTISDSSMSGDLHYYSYLLNIHKEESSPALLRLMEIYSKGCHVNGPAVQFRYRSYLIIT
jgi:hypothetical protein